MKKLFSLLALLTFTTAGQAANTSARVERIDVLEGGKNVLLNPSFDQKSFSQNWLALGSATTAVETSTVVDGKQAAKITITASGDGLAQSLLPGVNTLSQQMEASCKVNTSMTNIQLCATAGGVEQSCQSVPATGSYQAVSANFQGPVNGTAVGVKIKSTSAGTGAVYADDCFVGPARNLSQVSQAQVVGSLKYAPTTSCLWQLNTGAWSSFPANACAPTPVVSGNAQAPATKIPGITLPTVQPGTYVLYAAGAMLSTGSNANNISSRFRFSDGTNGSDEEADPNFYQNGTTLGSVNTLALGAPMIGSFTYTSAQSNVTFQLQAINGNSTSSIDLTNSALVIKVLYYPSSATGTTALTSANNVANWAGYHTATSGNFNVTTGATAGTFSDYTSGPTGLVLNTRGTPRNITCTNGSTTSPSISCNLPKAGNYSVCYSTATADQTASSAVFTRMVDGSGTVVASSSNQSPTSTFWMSQSACGSYSASSAGTVLFKLQASASSGSQNITLGLNGYSNNESISWSITALDGMGGPVILPATASSGATNYLTGGDGESGANICTPYADAAGVAPVTGSGGSPTVSCALSSTSPISGSQSYVLTKPASNVQGQGWSFPFTVDASAQAKMLQVSFDYQVDSNYTVGSDTSTPDIVAYVYGPTDGTPQLTQLTPYKALGGSGTLKFQGNLQTAASGKAYRLILHEPNTGTLASSIKVDNIVVSPVLRQFGTPVTDLQTYTPVWTGTTTSPSLGSPSVNIAQWRRVGDSAEITYTLQSTGTGATAGAGAYLFALPPGLSIDTTKVQVLATTSTQSGSSVGGGNMVYSGPSQFVVVAHAYDTTHLGFSFHSGGSNTAQEFAAVNAPFNGPVTFFSFKASVPIQGWSSSTQMSDQSGDNRLVSAIYTTTGTGTVANGTWQLLGFSNKVSDTHGAFNTSTNLYTCPVSGTYDVSSAISFTANTTGQRIIAVYKNGTFYNYLARLTGSGDVSSPAGTIQVPCNGQDTLSIYVFQNSGGSLALSEGAVGPNTLLNYLSIKRQSGNQQIAASESVSMKYTLSANASVTSAAAILFDTKVYDSHNAYNPATGGFKCPSQGKYHITAVSALTASSINVNAYKNGVVDVLMGGWDTSHQQAASGTVTCNAGDIIDVRTQGAATVYGGSGQSIMIEKVAN